MSIYYEDARLTVTEQDGKYRIFDRKYNRAIHKNVSKAWVDDFIGRVLSKRENPHKPRADNSGKPKQAIRKRREFPNAKEKNVIFQRRQNR